MFRPCGTTGWVFEDYDFPGLKTEDGIAHIGAVGGGVVQGFRRQHPGDQRRPLGRFFGFQAMCDTFVAFGSATADGALVFGKNSDRPADEEQVPVHLPGRRYSPGAEVRCTYIEIPQAAETFAVVLSQPTWMWGAEMAVSDQGVVIGNEAVWTNARLGPPALLGMDLVRLGAERGATARQAVDVITGLLGDPRPGRSMCRT